MRQTALARQMRRSGRIVPRRVDKSRVTVKDRVLERRTMGYKILSGFRM